MSITSVLFSFSGRIPRRTYWLWTLVLFFTFIAIILVLGAVTPLHSEQPAPAPGALHTAPAATSAAQDSAGELFGIVVLLLLIPTLWIKFAVLAKRWHDRDKSGWMCLINLVPVLGIWTFIECGCQRGTVGPNQFGPDPT